ncbi:hypothetical protein PMG11_08406 [Penicillium brasilianum]|uniref:Zn(2)-C6 fungal-type domain-containing protein n=1 Tax=Penicillium brasilianum TaxID=104259 RepID=A0A0F7TXK3_PENBI|nr:hypothetical protein PMG11_08406 [Penicillium brasilianum]
MRGTILPEVSRESESNRSESGDHPKDDLQPPPKRAKREKYVSKACAQCQRRKIKCDGNAPCRACTFKGRDCQRVGTDMRGRWRAKERASTRSQDLASRMSIVERQLGLVEGPETGGCAEPERTHGAFGHGGSSRRQDISPVQESSDRIWSSRSQVPTFSGETSVAHSLTVVEGRLKQMGVEYKRLRSASPSQQFISRLTPSPNEAPEDLLGRNTSFIPRVLDAHRIVPDRRQWDGLLRTFCDEVQILVPFLHLPSLWHLHDELWKSGWHDGFKDQPKQGSHRVQAAQLLLCIANGKCVESARLEDDRGPYSAGWSLYSAAREIFGDLIDGFRQCEDQVLVLQTVVLMVVYLFRLDAHGSAEKILALAISHAHHIGLHRERVVSAMSAFQSEMARRLWWCIYLLDRRLAIETGRPFLIQDINVDVGLPSNVSDEWLTTNKTTQLAMNPNAPTKEQIPTSVPYLIAMISYSKVIGKVWEALYGAGTSDSSPSPLLHEYLEHLTTQSQRGLQKEFTHDPYHEDKYNSEGLAWWQVKQHLMMRMRWCSLYLLIRKPMLRKTRSDHNSSPEEIENEVICMRLAQRIIDDFKNVPEEHPKYTFPFLHYLTSATIIALGLIIKQPSFTSSYGALTLRATQSLKEHCRKTWMSGKMIHTVWKLRQIADAILSSSNIPLDRLSHSAGGASGVPATKDLAQRTSKNGRSPSLHSTMVNPIRSTMSSPAPSIEHRRYIDIITNPYIRTAPDAGALSGVTETHSYQRTDPTREGARTTRSKFGGDGHPTLGDASSQGPEAFPYHTTQISNGTESDVRMRGEEDAQNYCDGYGAVSSQMYGFVPPEGDIDAPLPGEMINRGMEWLQSLFSNGVDTQILPVWD